MLSGKNLVKSYGALNVLKGVDIEVGKSEIVSIVGASGAGKSTLLHILGTLDSPDQGELIIGGQNVSTLSSTALSKFRNSKIGFVFQFHNLLPEFTSFENVCIPGFIAGKKEEDVYGKARKIMAELNIDHRKNHKPGELSGGEQQRVAVARALINDPDIVFADEPSGNLDSKHAGELHQLFFDLRDKFGQTFIIVTHNEVLANMADRKLEIQDGKILNEYAIKG